MALLLPLLAALQYHWLGQVSEGATARLQSSLRSSATAFRHDFNRELIRAYLNFHADSFATAEDIERFHVERFERWRQTAPYPRLISNVFIVTYDDQKRPLANRVDPQTRRLVPTDWSGELSTLRERFAARSLEPGADNSKATNLQSFADDVPALIIPLQTPTDQQIQSPPGFTVVKLDLDYLQNEFIPELTKRHSFDVSSEYDVAITSLDDPARVIYSSRQPMGDFNNADVSTQIFGLEAEELEAFLRTDNATPAISVQPGQRPARLVKLRLLKHANVGSTISPDQLDGRWRLSIRHRAGSLAAAVTQARRRNLAISFGILLLLGAGVLMTAISTRRAQRLAQQQIDFVAGVTHELRTPLAVICSAGENLADGIVDTPQKARQYGDAIYREGRRLTDMVEQVLEFAGAQSGRQRYEFRPLKVADVVAAAIAACEPQIREKNFNVETLIAPDVPLVKGDSVALRRVLQNLITNGIKYDGQSRWLRVSAQTSRDEPGVCITVEDRGLGIDATDIPHIFEPFYRGREALASQIEGSGVGLSVVKQIVEAHGGKISVKSTPGTGTTFTLEFPIDFNVP